MNRLEAGNRLSASERVKETKLKKGGMRIKPKLVTTIMLALFLVGMLVATVAAQPKKPLRCELYIELNWDWIGFGVGTSPYTWIGTVSGDINGDIYVTLTGASFPGKTEHFSETWIIETADGSISGFDEGVWRMSNFKWVANGGVTSADGTWSYLVGSKMQYRGTTTEFPVPFGTPVNGAGTLMIVPGSY